jgi:hypothetical protein
VHVSVEDDEGRVRFPFQAMQKLPVVEDDHRLVSAAVDGGSQKLYGGAVVRSYEDPGRATATSMNVHVNTILP